MNGLPIRAFSTTCVAIRLAFGRRRDSSRGFGGSVFWAGSGAAGLCSEPQDASIAASAITKQQRRRIIRSIAVYLCGMDSELLNILDLDSHPRFPNSDVQPDPK